MPGVYRLKQCPQCQKEHRKRGPFCSQGCHNSHRVVSDKQREHGRKLGKENAGDPALIAAGYLLGKGTITSAEDYAVDIPYIPDIDPDIPTDFQ